MRPRPLTLFLILSLAPSLGHAAADRKHADLFNRLHHSVTDPHAPDLLDSIQDFKLIAASPSFSIQERKLALFKLTLLSHVRVEAIQALHRLAQTLPVELQPNVTKARNYAIEMLAQHVPQMAPSDGAVGIYGEDALTGLRALAKEGNESAQRAAQALASVPGGVVPTRPQVTRAYFDARLEFLEDVLIHEKPEMIEAPGELRRLLFWQNPAYVLPEQRVTSAQRIAALRLLRDLAEGYAEGEAVLDEFVRRGRQIPMDDRVHQVALQIAQENIDKLRDRVQAGGTVEARAATIARLQNRAAAGSTLARDALTILAESPGSPDIWRPAQAALQLAREKVPSIPLVQPSAVQLTLEQGAVAMRGTTPETRRVTEEMISGWRGVLMGEFPGITPAARDLALQQWSDLSLTSDEARHSLLMLGPELSAKDPVFAGQVRAALTGYYRSLPPPLELANTHLDTVRYSLTRKKVSDHALLALEKIIQVKSPSPLDLARAEEAIMLLMQANRYNPLAGRILERVGQSPHDFRLTQTLQEAQSAIRHGTEAAHLCMMRIRKLAPLRIPPSRWLTGPTSASGSP